MPSVDSTGLATALRYGGFSRIVLLTYQQLKGVPDSVEVQDAQQHLSIDVFNQALNVLPVPLISDLVRLRAIEKHGLEVHRSAFQMHSANKSQIQQSVLNNVIILIYISCKAVVLLFKKVHFHIYVFLLHSFIP